MEYPMWLIREYQIEGLKPRQYRHNSIQMTVNIFLKSIEELHLVWWDIWACDTCLGPTNVPTNVQSIRNKKAAAKFSTRNMRNCRHARGKRFSAFALYIHPTIVYIATCHRLSIGTYGFSFGGTIMSCLRRQWHVLKLCFIILPI